MDRRTTLKTGLLAGASTLLAQVPAIGAGPGAVTSALAVYSSNIAAKLKDGAVHIRATIDDMDAFGDVAIREAAFPYERVHAEGNLLKFEHLGTKYSVENVFPKRLA